MDGLEALTLRPFDDAGALVADPAALRAAAAERGYLYLRGLLAPAQLRGLRRGVLAACDAMGLLAPRRRGAQPRARPGARLVPYASEEWMALQQRVAMLGAFRRLPHAPALLDALAALFGAPPVPHRGDVCRVFLPGAPELATPPHQDLFFQGRYGVPEGARSWSAWIPLGDCPLALGGLAVVPGSHRLGLLPHEPPDDPTPTVVLPPDVTWAASPLGAGDVVLVSSLTVHRALPNRTADRVRLSVDLRYVPGASPAP